MDNVSKDEFLRARRKAERHADDTENPHNVTKEQAGLGNVTNDKQIPYTGWTELPACTYAGTAAFTFAGDYTGALQKWDKIKLTNGTVKYFYAASISYNAGTGLTTVTAAGCGLYSLESGSISMPYYSKVENPQGWPEELNMYGPHPMRCVYYEKVSSSAKTSVSITADVMGSALSVAAAGQYILQCRFINTSGSDSNYRLRINGDTAYTGYYTRWDNNGSISSYDNASYLIYINSAHTTGKVEAKIELIDADLQVLLQGIESSGGATPHTLTGSITKPNGGGSDITQLEIASQAASAIGIGSEISLWSLSGR